MLTKKAKYALRALFILAQNKNKPMLIAEIAEQQQIPKKFLEAILIQLKNNGLLYSNRGRIGGYQLLINPDEITFGKVIRIMDGPLANILCASRNSYISCVECASPETCSIRITMLKVRDAAAAILDTTTISDAILYEKEINIF